RFAAPRWHGLLGRAGGAGCARASGSATSWAARAVVRVADQHEAGDGRAHWRLGRGASRSWHPLHSHAVGCPRHQHVQPDALQCRGVPAEAGLRGVGRQEQGWAPDLSRGGRGGPAAEEAAVGRPAGSSSGLSSARPGRRRAAGEERRTPPPPCTGSSTSAPLAARTCSADGGSLPPCWRRAAWWLRKRSCTRSFCL
ncbi:unnamed protein product, partial [Prorocentrum cordatum]